MEKRKFDELFSDRLLSAVNNAGVSQAEFARDSGITPGYLTDILKGRTKPSDRVVEKICSVFSLNERWLRFGDGEMLQAGNDGHEGRHHVFLDPLARGSDTKEYRDDSLTIAIEAVEMYLEHKGYRATAKEKAILVREVQDYYLQTGGKTPSEGLLGILVKGAMSK